MQAASSATGNFAAMFVGRFVAGLGVGAASMLTPLYVSECAPRAVRGGLTCKDKSVFASVCLCRLSLTSIFQRSTSSSSSLALCLRSGMCKEQWLNTTLPSPVPSLSHTPSRPIPRRNTPSFPTPLRPMPHPLQLRHPSILYRPAPSASSQNERRA